MIFKKKTEEFFHLQFFTHDKVTFEEYSNFCTTIVKNESATEDFRRRLRKYFFCAEHRKSSQGQLNIRISTVWGENINFWKKKSTVKENTHTHPHIQKCAEFQKNRCNDAEMPMLTGKKMMVSHTHACQRTAHGSKIYNVIIFSPLELLRQYFRNVVLMGKKKLFFESQRSK